MDLATTVRLAGYGLGTVGAAMLFLEFFQLPSYVTYDENIGYSVTMTPEGEVAEHTWAGRVGALLVAVCFALQFLAVFLS